MQVNFQGSRRHFCSLLYTEGIQFSAFIFNEKPFLSYKQTFCQETSNIPPGRSLRFDLTLLSYFFLLTKYQSKVINFIRIIYEVCYFAFIH